MDKKINHTFGRPIALDFQGQTQKEHDSVTWECKVLKKKLLSNGFASN